MVINKSNIIIIKEIIIIPLDIICKHITDFTCVRTIDRTAAIKDKIDVYKRQPYLSVSAGRAGGDVLYQY